MQRWEYNLLVQSPNTECARCEEALNGLGRDGYIAKLPELVRKPWPFSGLDYRQPPGLTWP
jgi:hypothetical protein